MRSGQNCRSKFRHAQNMVRKRPNISNDTGMARKWLKSRYINKKYVYKQIIHVKGGRYKQVRHIGGGDLN